MSTLTLLWTVMMILISPLHLRKQKRMGKPEEMLKFFTLMEFGIRAGYHHLILILET